MWMFLALSGCVADSEPEVETEAPGQINVSHPLLDFGAVKLHEESSQIVGISNLGEGPLQIYDVAFSDDTRRPHWRLSGGLSGELASGSGVELEVVVRPQDLTDPDVTLIILSDDPETPEISLPLYADVEGTPDIRLTPDTLSFGAVVEGDSVTLPIEIANDGSADLLIKSVSFTGGGASFSLAVDPTGVNIAPQNADGLVMVEFLPQALGVITDNIVIVSNDPDTPSATVVLTGQGTLAQ
ncbi:MAG: hypothetical protein ACI8RZ_001551 [Myxococcota bacterium]|jgi:hypothetical protein